MGFQCLQVCVFDGTTMLSVCFGGTTALSIQQAPVSVNVAYYYRYEAASSDPPVPHAHLLDLDGQKRITLREVL